MNRNTADQHPSKETSVPAFKRFLAAGALAIATLVSFSGCARLHGITRQAPTRDFPPADAVAAVLSRVPGVTSVTASSHESQATGAQLIGATKAFVQEFSVVGTKDRYDMQFTMSADGRFISMTRFSREASPASFRIADTRAFMSKTYGALRARFPILPPEGDFKETVYAPDLESN